MQRASHILRRAVWLPLAYMQVASALGGLSRHRDPADAFAAARRKRFAGRSVAPHQIEREFVRLLELVADERPSTVVEIGTANGGSIALLARAAADDALLLTLELMRPPLGSWSPLGLLCRGARLPGQRITPLFGRDSHDLAVRDEVVWLLGDRVVDMLFIDGDHSYDGVRRDFELYAGLVRAGGIVAFHDIVPGPEASVGGVPRFWREVSTTHDSQEIVESWSQGGFGIGVLRVGSTAS